MSSDLTVDENCSSWTAVGSMLVWVLVGVGMGFCEVHAQNQKNDLKLPCVSERKVIFDSSQYSRVCFVQLEHSSSTREAQLGRKLESWIKYHSQVRETHGQLLLSVCVTKVTHSGYNSVGDWLPSLNEWIYFICRGVIRNTSTSSSSTIYSINIASVG